MTDLTSDQFTEASVRRGAYLDAAREADDATALFPDNLECAPAIGALQGLAQRLRRLADHHTTAEQPAGLTWEARADHAVRLYARTAIELEDTKAETARLRARVAELEQPPTAVEEAPADTVRRYARRLHAVEQLAVGRPGYHTVTVKQLLTAMSEAEDKQAPAAAAQTVTVAHVETALRSWLTDFDYDQHKALQCGEDDGADHYPDEAEAFFGYLLAAASLPA